MPRLETVEDFERIARALSDPSSKLSDYCVVDFGYCDFCSSITIFDWILEPNHIHCQGCKNHFYPDHMGLSYLFYNKRQDGTTIRVFEFKVGKDIPEQQQRVSRNGHQFFRSHQRRLFNQLLETRIKEIKKEQRVLAGKVRRLAKLRS